MNHTVYQLSASKGSKPYYTGYTAKSVHDRTKTRVRAAKKQASNGRTEPVNQRLKSDKFTTHPTVRGVFLNKRDALAFESFLIQTETHTSKGGTNVRKK